MADGVAKIQLHPGTGVEFVLHDHIPLQLYASGDDRFPVKIQAFFFQMGEKLGVVKNAILDDLGAAVPEDIHRKGVQGVGVADDKTGLPEGSG